MDIEPLISALSTPHTFYLLGAGASAGLVPLKFKETIEREYLDGGIYRLPEEIERSEITKRILGEINYSQMSLQKSILNEIPNSFVEAMVMTSMVRPKPDQLCSNYRIFNWSRHPLTLFNMNTDGIAKRVCLGHNILEPHGSIDEMRRIINAPRYNEYLDYLRIYAGEHIKAPCPPDLLLPQRESANITNRLEYQWGESFFRRAPYFVIIGYSFGHFGDALDDLETFEYFRYLLRKNPCPIIVIDPNPDMLIMKVVTKLKQMHVIRANWDLLSKAIIVTAIQQRCNSLSSRRLIVKQVRHTYDSLCG